MAFGRRVFDGFRHAVILFTNRILYLICLIYESESHSVCLFVVILNFLMSLVSPLSDLVLGAVQLRPLNGPCQI